MKKISSLRRRCPKCKIIKRHGIYRRICEIAKHKAKQG